jgi:hypothetical protein
MTVCCMLYESRSDLAVVVHDHTFVTLVFYSYIYHSIVIRIVIEFVLRCEDEKNEEKTIVRL